MSATAAVSRLDSNLDEMQYSAVRLLRGQLGRKFEIEDLLHGEYREELTDIAEKYVETYRGTFEFVQDVARAVRKYHNLTPNQAKGLLNCIVAEWSRELERRKTEEEFNLDLELPATPREWEIPDGKFTLVRAGEENRTYKIKTLDQEHCDRYHKPTGTRMLMFLNGPDNLRDYALFAWVTPNGKVQPRAPFKSGTPLMNGAQFLINADRKEALRTAKAFALMSNQCAICGAELTDQDSIEMGIGPICASKF